MDKRINGLAGAMREIAEQRDKQLRDAKAISADRLEHLNAFLTVELPVETALFAAARQCDASLSLPEPSLPAVVHSALVEQVRSVRAAAKPRDVLRHFGGYRAAAIIVAAAVVALALVHFSRLNNQANRISHELQPSSIIASGPAGFSNVFDRAADQLSLRVGRLELASLQPSLLTINRALPDLQHADRVLPLDLPIRQIRLDVEAVRTP